MTDGSCSPRGVSDAASICCGKDGTELEEFIDQRASRHSSSSCAVVGGQKISSQIPPHPEGGSWIRAVFGHLIKMSGWEDISRTSCRDYKSHVTVGRCAGGAERDTLPNWEGHSLDLLDLNVGESRK